MRSRTIRLLTHAIIGSVGISIGAICGYCYPRPPAVLPSPQKLDEMMTLQLDDGTVLYTCPPDDEDHWFTGAYHYARKLNRPVAVTQQGKLIVLADPTK